MENVTRALILAGSMMLFVIGFAYSMYLINHLMTTSESLLDTVSTKNYYDNLVVDRGHNTREVGVETIISTLYRYHKESYSVKIYTNGGTLVQLFDLKIEGKMAAAEGFSKPTVSTKADKELKSLQDSIYLKSNNPAYLYAAPWIGNDENILARINYFLNGTKGYINSKLVDYSKSGPLKSVLGTSSSFLDWATEKTFIEEFVEYAYTGDTISTANGLETITGNSQEESKIVITYTVKE